MDGAKFCKVCGEEFIRSGAGQAAVLAKKKNRKELSRNTMIFGSISVAAAAVEGHMGVEKVTSVKKAGKDRLSVTEISFSENVRREYYSTSYPIFEFAVDELDTLGNIDLGDGSTKLRLPDGREVY